MNFDGETEFSAEEHRSRYHQLKEKFEALTLEHNRLKREANLASNPSNSPLAADMSEADFRPDFVLQSISDPFCFLDFEQRVRYINEHAASIIGKPARECYGQTMRELLSEEENSSFSREFQRALQSQTRVDLTEFWAKSQIWVKYAAYPSQEGLSVYFRDVTQLVENSREKEVAAEAARQLIRAPASIFWTADADGNFVNWTEWCSFTGQKPEQVLHLGWLDAVAFDERAQVSSRWEQCLASREALAAEFRIWHEAEGYRWYSVRAVPVILPDGTLREWIGHCEDIHDRKEAESLFRAAMELSTIGILVWNTSGAVEVANPEFLRMLRFEEEQFRSAKLLFQDITPAEYHEADQRFFDELIGGGSPEAYEKEYVRTDGTRFTAVVGGRLLPQDRSRGMAYVMDVSDRKQQEKSLKVAEERLRLASQAARIGIWDWDIHSGEVSLHLLSSQILGLPADREQYSIRELFDLVLADNQERVWADIRHAVELEASYSDEWQIRSPDGSTRWIASDSVVYYSRDHKPDRMVGTLRDITSEVTQRELVREQETQYRQIAESLPQLVWTSRADGTPTYLNEPWYQFTGASKELDLSLMWQYMQPDDRQRLRDLFADEMAKGSAHSFECRIRSAEDDAYRWFLGITHPIKDGEGNILKWFGTLTDIQEQKDMEAELERRVEERTAELKLAYSEMESFNYSISHDLRTPCRTIVSTSSMVLLDYADELPEEAVELLNRQSRAAKKLSVLIDDLLTLSRLGRQVITREHFNLSELVSEALNSLDPANSKIHIQPDIIVLGDPSMIRLVLDNLLSNAVKYSPQGGHIKVHSSKSEEETEILISDEGIGFEMQYADKLFKPFERLHRDEDFPGTGVGLANVKRIVERHNGRVWAESPGPNLGSTFGFTLPNSTDVELKTYSPA